jgi:hypothetical protein
MSSVGVRRQLFNNKATVNLRVQDPFELAWMSFETRDRTHLQIARKNCSMHSATLLITYNFGRRPRSVRRPGAEEAQAPAADPMGMPQP